ncbi:MAG: iron permease [Pusillimonas sp.]|jgi:high-affinity iron transporter|nr:iron permease [Pusillimonas sp.]
MTRPLDFRWFFRALLLSCIFFSAIALAQDVQTQSRQLWQLLDYIAVDYPGAVKNGQIISETEYAEMKEFGEVAQFELNNLPAHPDKAGLLDQVKTLQQKIQNKSAPIQVAQAARQLAQGVHNAYPFPTEPEIPPDLTVGLKLYQANCVQCHGASGKGNGPLAAQLDPTPTDFTDAARAAQRSKLALYQVISNGVDGTAMPSFDALSDQERWALAYFVADFASSSNQENASGRLSLARSQLKKSLKALEQGQQDTAIKLALSAYLDGFETNEAALAIRNNNLMRQIESGMIAFRTQVRRNDIAQARTTEAQLQDWLTDAEAALSPSEAGSGATFIAAFTILVREGLEALLIVVAMLAFLVKANRRDVTPYVHAGWVSALFAGGATWLAATTLINISGAGRELTEGLSSLFAALVLLSVGAWMHHKSVANRWQTYLQNKLSHALTRRTAWFLFILAFIAVYREVFETVLFYAALWQPEQAWAFSGGILAGIIVLAVIARALFKSSQRLPIGRFFSASSIIVALLAIVLTGKGIVGLQEAGVINITPIQFIRVDLLGIYPSAQSIGAQAVMLIVLLFTYWINTRTK